MSFFLVFVFILFRLDSLLFPFAHPRVRCRFPSWPVWSPRFSKLRLSKRGDVSQPPSVVSFMSADGPISNKSSSSSGIGGDGGPDAIRPNTSPMASCVGPRNWRPISPLACRPTTLKPPSPDGPPRVPLSPAAAASVIPPTLEFSLGHSRYHYVTRPTLVICYLILVFVRPMTPFAGKFAEGEAKREEKDDIVDPHAPIGRFTTSILFDFLFFFLFDIRLAWQES